MACPDCGSPRGEFCVATSIETHGLDYLNNILEQDHRFIKKRITAGLRFRSAEEAWRTIEGYEAMHAIRKGQIRWLRKGDIVGQRRFIHALFGIAA